MTFFIIFRIISYVLKKKQGKNDADTIFWLLQPLLKNVQKRGNTRLKVVSNIS